MQFLKNIHKEKIILIYFFFYILLIIGFVFNENLSGGAKLDYLFQKHYIAVGFNNGIKEFIFDFYPSSTLSQHSPLYYVYAYILKLFVNNEILERFITLNIFLLIPFILIRCLEIKFNSKYLYLLPLVIFISPVFRSTIIWSGREIIALIFLTLSFYFALKAQKDFKDNNVYLAFIYLIFSSYFKFEYGLITLIYFIWFFNFLKKATFVISVLINIILSIPFFLYYLNFIDFKIYNLSIAKNIYTNIVFFFSTYFFYLLPFLLQKENSINFFIFIKKYFYFLIISLFVFFFIYTNIEKSNIGGGGIYQILIKLDLAHFIVFFSSLGLIGHIFLTRKYYIYNTIILLILILQTCINFHFFQKYLDLFFLIQFFLLLRINNLENWVKNKKFINNIILFFTIYYFATLMFRFN